MSTAAVYTTTRARSSSRARRPSISHQRARSLSNLSLSSPKFRPSLDLFSPLLEREGLSTLPLEIFQHICSFLHPLGPLASYTSNSANDTRLDLLNLASVNKAFYSACSPRLFHTIDLRYCSVHRLGLFVDYALYQHASSIRILLYDFSSLNLFPESNPAALRASYLSKMLTTVERLESLSVHFGGLDSRNRWMNEGGVLQAFRGLVDAVKDVGTSYSLKQLEIYGPAPRPYPMALEVLDGLLARHATSLEDLTADRWTEDSPNASSRLSNRLIASHITTLTLKGTFTPFITLPTNLQNLSILNPVNTDFFIDILPLLSTVAHSLTTFEWAGDSVLPEGFGLRPQAADEDEIKVEPIAFERLETIKFHPDSLSQPSSQFWEDELEALFLRTFSHPSTPLRKVEYSRNSHNLFIRTISPLLRLLQEKRVGAAGKMGLEEIRIGRSREWNWVMEEEWEKVEKWSKEVGVRLVWNARTLGRP
ncbi:hypothetical protein BT69DRAFT_1149582 [Atractiella rhizophila]|nr:hypothetical protein BT69DRAFT_1149582 [Atractiella rhizophila]